MLIDLFQHNILSASLGTFSLSSLPPFPIKPFLSIMSPPSSLFTPLQVGTSLLQHRVGLAPLTRFRASALHVPTGEFSVHVRSDNVLTEETVQTSWWNTTPNGAPRPGRSSLPKRHSSHLKQVAMPMSLGSTTRTRSKAGRRW